MTQDEANVLTAYIKQSMLPDTIQIQRIKKNRSYSVSVTLLSRALQLSVLDIYEWQGIKAAWSLYIAVPCDWCRSLIPAEEGQFVAVHDVFAHIIEGEETVCRACVRAYRDAYAVTLAEAS